MCVYLSVKLYVAPKVYLLPCYAGVGACTHAYLLLPLRCLEAVWLGQKMRLWSVGHMHARCSGRVGEVVRKLKKGKR